MDKLTSIRAFVAVAEHGGFSAAAESERLSKGMMSKHIQALEHTLGTRLFNRSTRRLKLTEAGVAYLAGCQRVLEDLAILEQRIAGFGNKPQGLLKVLAPTSFGSFQLAPALADYAERYPDVQVQLTLSDRAHGPLEEGVDLALHIGGLPDSSLIARQIAEVQLIVCGAPAYFARHGEPQTPADLAAHNCLRYSQGARKGMWLFHGDNGDLPMRVHGDFEASTGDAVRMAALSGHGLVQLPNYMVRGDLIAARLRATLQAQAPAPTPLYVVYAHRELSATVRVFIEYLEQHFHDQVATLSVT
ncbi:MAG: LysR family transcriptional regulator [Gammaproteobacteria bacterium]|nr:LysR family transcriptional regulator [Gammaproteobacteria bacterium]